MLSPVRLSLCLSVRQTGVWWKFHNHNFNRFWLIHPCDGRTDGRAIAYSGNSALSICCLALKKWARVAYMRAILTPFGVYHKPLSLSICRWTRTSYKLTEGFRRKHAQFFVRHFVSLEVPMIKIKSAAESQYLNQKTSLVLVIDRQTDKDDCNILHRASAK